jgi:DNA polymerase-3 subunit epsilon
MNNNPLNRFFHKMLSLDFRKADINKETEAWNRRIYRESIENQRIISRPLKELMVTAIDSETTGFHPEAGDEIISLAGVKLKGQTSVDPYDTFVMIQGTIPARIIELTGIQPTDLEGAPSLYVVLSTFMKYIDSTVLVGYYVGHDVKFLNYYLWKNYRTRLYHRVLDLKSITPILFPHCTDPTFDQVCEWFQIENQARHTALGDALAASELWQRMIYELERKDITTLQNLYEQLSLLRHHS